MNRVVTLLLIIALVPVGAAACGSGPEPATTPGTAPATVGTTATQDGGLGLLPAPWQDGETADYDVLSASGNKIGTSQIAIAAQGDAWAVFESDKIVDLDQSWTIRIDAKTLRPLGQEKTIHTSATDATISTTYDGGKLSIKAVVKGEQRSASLDVPSNSIDNDQLLVTLRALPFAEGYEAKYTTVVAQNALKVGTTVRVKARETVSVPAGSFETWRVELDFGQGKQQAWYSVAAPHRLVQYDNGATRMVLTK